MTFDRPALARSLGRTGAAVAVCVGLSAVAGAHEIGTTRVAVAMPQTGHYEVQIVTDATSLLDKLEIASGRPRSRAYEPSDVQRRVGALLDVFAGRVLVSFDGVRVRPSLTVAVEPSSEVGGVPGATVTLSGEYPPAARTFAWQYGWTVASYALTVRAGPAGAATTQWVEGSDSSRPVALDQPVPAESQRHLAAKYVALGFTHIIPKGLDHVLFVLGLFLLSRKMRPLLLQVSAFTVAHSITLGLSMYGLVSVPASVVEPLIALSIAYIAVENLLVQEFRPRRVALVFAFGLLHGLGFAGALRSVGMPPSEFVTALVGFNVGVELGQLAVIAAAFLAVGYWYGNRVWYRRRIVVPASICIAGFGLFWAVQRLHLG